MQDEAFKLWLQQRGAESENGRRTRVHAVRTIENNLAKLGSPHADLEAAWKADRFDQLRRRLSDVPVTALRWDAVVLDRTNSRWRELLNLARLLLGDRFQTTSSGGSDGFSLLFEMNVLFEEYVARMLKRGLAGSELRVVSQGGRLNCLQTEDQRGLFQTRPDILIKHGDEVVQVIDTKWKRIADRVDDPKRGVSQGDVYQMMVYGELYRSSTLTLLYPHHSGLEGHGGILADHVITGGSKRLRVATVDISRMSGISERLAAFVPGASGLELMPS